MLRLLQHAALIEGLEFNWALTLAALTLTALTVYARLGMWINNKLFLNWTEQRVLISLNQGFSAGEAHRGYTKF